MKPRLLITALFLLLFVALPASAAEEWLPYQPTPEETEIHVWTSGSTTLARVKFTFRDCGTRIIDWGSVQRSGNDFSVDIKAERWTGIVCLAITTAEHIYDLGTLSPGAYTFTVKSRGATIESSQFDPSQVVEHWEPFTPAPESVLIAIRTDGGVTFAFPTIFCHDTPCRATEWGPVTRNGNDFSIDVKMERWTGQPTRNNRVQQTYSLGPTPPGSYSFSVNSRGTLLRRQPFTVSASSGQYGNPIDDPVFFVRQHYIDFLSREPESSGLTYWTDGLIIPCNGQTPCINNIRHHTSAAFFISDEFQRTGYFIYLLNKATTGARPSYADFMRDRTRVIDRADLETSKRSFVEEWTKRDSFKQAYPETLMPEEFVNKLFDTAQLFPYTGERARMSRMLKDTPATRADVLRALIEMEEFRQREYNPAFVLMQYFGYLQRDPDEAGYQFWLDVVSNRDVNNYLGMVQAFVNSVEYRARFGQP
jgi:hypothetical protein